MSDLNDLIATNAINSFNSGVQTGITQERERIIKLLEGLIDTRPDESNGGWRGYSLERIIEAIKGEQK